MGEKPVSLLPSEAFAAEDAADLQALWLRLRREPFRTLALVPAGEGLSLARFAKALAAAAAVSEREEVQVIDTAALTPEALSALAAGLRDRATAGLQIVTLPSPLGRPQAALVAGAADAAVLCVRLGESGFAEGKQTVEAVGKDRFVGCVALRS